MNRRFLVLLAASLLSAAASQADELADCAAALPNADDPYAGALCFFEVGARSGHWAASRDALLSAEASRPEDPWLRLVQGHVEWPLDETRAASLYAEAAELFRQAGILRGELVARGNLGKLLLRSGRSAEAAAQVDRVEALGALTEDTELKIRALIIKATHDWETGRNIGRAYGVLREAQRRLTAEQPYWLHKEVLAGLGNLALVLGRYDDAIAHFETLQLAASEAQDQLGLAFAGFSSANARVERADEAGVALRRDALVADVKGALETAVAAGAGESQARLHRLLGELLAIDDPEAAEAHLNDCEHTARDLGAPGQLGECLWWRARVIAARAPEEAQAVIREAIALMREIEDETRLFHAWRHHMRITWTAQAADIALAEAHRTLTVLDALRALQDTEQGRIGLLSAWSRDYYWLSGELLRMSDGRNSARIGEALAVMERMRARALLDQLLQDESADPASRERTQLLQSIVATNRKLLASSDPAERSRLQRRLEQFEDREIALRPRTPVAGTSEELLDGDRYLISLQRALEPGEALLSFQLGLHEDVRGAFAGGAWVVLVTAKTTSAFPLADRNRIAEMVPAFLGLLNGAGDSVPADVHRNASRAMYRALFEDAIAELPEDTSRLIVIPDGDLHQLPIGAVSATADGSAALLDRFELVLAPSASAWLHWRRSAAGPRSAAGFVFANPTPYQGHGVSIAARHSASVIEATKLGALPFAAREGRRVRDHLDSGSRLLTGDSASEAALKTAELGDYGVLHFAAHAVLDGENPERSAVLLSPGDRAEDGLLQSREISALPLAGQIVVLSACRSANGAQLRGEGMLGLARSFFAAGAGAVVGSYWPVRDAQADAFFRLFYASLSRGETASGALRAAQRELRSRGYPAEIWAGFTVLGDATRLPALQRRSAAQKSQAALAICALAMALGIAWLVRRGRRNPVNSDARR